MTPEKNPVSPHSGDSTPVAQGKSSHDACCVAPQEFCCALPEAGGGNCPRCGRKGKPVLKETVDAWVLLPGRACLGDAPFFICTTPACPAVYYTVDGKTAVTAEVQARVGLKQGAGITPVCYCFGHTVESIESELRITGKTSVIELISAEIKAGRCACETKNPEGRCCLGSVSQLVKDAKEKYNKPVDHPKDDEAPVVCNSTLCAT